MNNELLQRARALHQAGQVDAAMAMYERMLGAAPADSEALYLLGVGSYQKGDLERAARLIGQSLSSASGSAGAWYIHGTILLSLKRYDQALASFDRALELDPNSTDSLINRGVALTELKRAKDALVSLDRAEELAPGKLEIRVNRANALAHLKRYDEALALHESILARHPDHFSSLNNYGIALAELNRNAEAVACFNRALALFPDSVEALDNRAAALIRMRRLDEAKDDCDRALALRPDWLKPLITRALAHFSERNFAAAAYDYEMAQRADPGVEFPLEYLLYCRLHCCDWRHFAEDREKLLGGLLSGKNRLNSLAVQLVSLPPGQIERSMELQKEEDPVAPSLHLWRGEKYRHEKIRLAYVSADFRPHPVARQIAGVIEEHDRTRFEVVGVSYGPGDAGPLRRRIEAGADEFIDVAGVGDPEAAAMLRRREIDIAVDLTGFTAYCRPGILAYRPAPVQVNFLGFPATMNSLHIDYIVADRTVLPESRQKLYREKAAYLPDTFMPTDAKRRTADGTPGRAEAGLPERGFVFCCANNSCKITPEFFDIWMRLLRTVPESVLWLFTHAAAHENLKREAQARAIAAERLVFAPYLDSDEDHLARLGLANLFLDTLPYNAHATACDALWVGLPLITCEGDNFAGRVGASLLKAVGLSDLVTGSLEEYEALAHRLARDPALLRNFKAALVRNRATLPLFDTGRYCRKLEAAYYTMWERQQRSEPPASFAVG